MADARASTKEPTADTLIVGGAAGCLAAEFNAISVFLGRNVKPPEGRREEFHPGRGDAG